MELLSKDPILEDLFFKAHGDEIVTIFSQIYTPGTYEWIPADSYEKYTENFNKHSRNKDSTYFRSLLFYKDNPIEYNINEYGFRDDPLDTKPQEVDVYLGCSFSFGIGNHLEHVWTYKLQKYLNFPNINASVPGTGVITHYRMLVMLSKKYKIRNVFHFTDFEQPRIEWFKEVLNETKFNKSKYHNLLPTDETVTPEQVENMFNDRNITLMQHLCKYAIKGFCENANINLYTVYKSDTDRFNATYRPYSSTKDNPLISILPEFSFDSKNLNFLARDLSHLSIQRQHFVYLDFLTKLGVNIFNKNVKMQDSLI